jgi:hypothetical protein
MILGRRLLGGLAVLLLAGCASGSASPDESASASSPPSESASAPVPGSNGSVFVATWSDSGKSIMRYPINADGTVGEGVELVAVQDASNTEFPAVVDGVGDVVSTGTFSDYWTTDIQVRDATSGEVNQEIEAPRWCGGEGLTYNPCAQLDATRIARTSDLGGEGLLDSTIYISSLTDGSDLAELGPYTGLSSILGTTDPGALIILTTTTPNQDPPDPQPGTVQRLDVDSGDVTEIGEYPEAWAPLCAIGTDSVLGYTLQGAPQAMVVGSAQIGEAGWGDEDSPIGCSADGRFVYVQQIPQPPTEEYDDEGPANPATALVRIDLADGSRESVLTLESGAWAELVTR